MKTVSKEYDPIAMGPVRAKPEGFTPWMKLVINHGPEGTLRELIDWLAKEQNAEVMILSSGNACLYNAFLPAHKKRLDQKMPELYEEITKQKIPPTRNYLVLEVSASDMDDQVDTTLPTIKSKRSFSIVPITMRSPTVATLVLGLALLCQFITSGYEMLTMKRSMVTISMNKVWPFSNPTETYRYYDLPFCQPE
ncbi:conserved hypothetical protein, partial [Perkinsus marinus ATCC 50983]